MTVFIEVLNGKNKNNNIIVGCVYKHPNLSVNEFNSYLSKTLEVLSNENKKIIILCDFNIDLMQCDTHTDTSEFLDLMTSNRLSPLILRPTRFTPHSKTLIVNMFTNLIDIHVMAGSLTFSQISDHLAQFALLDFSVNNHKTPVKIFIRNFKNFDQNDFILDILSIDWENQITNLEPNDKLSFFINQVNLIFDKHVPLKKATSNPRLSKKNWITQGILASINKKNRMYKTFLDTKEQSKSDTLHKEFKVYRNSLTKIMRASKDAFYKNYFSVHKTNIKMAWKGIRTLINCKRKESSTPNSIIVDKKLINDPLEVANVFNSHFSTVAEKTKQKFIPSK